MTACVSHLNALAGLERNFLLATVSCESVDLRQSTCALASDLDVRCECTCSLLSSTILTVLVASNLEVVATDVSKRYSPRVAFATLNNFAVLNNLPLSSRVLRVDIAECELLVRLDSLLVALDIVVVNVCSRLHVVAPSDF